jgi:PAS domain S-box-containing protein
MTPTGPRRILLVEDEAIQALATSRLLESLGYETTIATSGERAVELIGQDPTIALVLMDIDLGNGIDSREAATRIQGSRTLPVVFLTSHSESQMVERVRGITRYGYVIKNSGDFVLRSSIEMAFELFEAQQAAQRSDDRYRLLFQNMSAGFALHEIIVDAAGKPCDFRFLELNRAFERLTGLDATKIIGRPVSEFHAATQGEWIERYGKIAMGGGPMRFENYRGDGGRTFDVAAYSPEPGRVASIIQEVTDRSTAVRALKEKTEELESFFTTALDLFCIGAPDGRLLRLNREWESLGYDLSDLEGHSCLDFVHPDDLATTVEAMANRTAQEQILGHVNRFRCKDGSWRWLEWRSTYKRDRVFAAARDITERVRAEATIRESEERFRTYVDAAPVGVFVADASGLLLQVNPATCALTGFAEAELLAMRPMDFVHPEALEEAGVHQARLLAEGSARGEIACRDKEGRRRCWAVEARRLSPSRFIGYVEDITDRRQTEDGLWAMVELQELLKAGGDGEGLMRKIMEFMSRLSGCEAVGIRLKKGDDYPYYVIRGFDDEFVQAENSLCARAADGETLFDAAGDPLLECMCGNILQGRVDPAKPFFTAHGSFWSNCTTEFLAAITEEERKARTRNRCNRVGYESVALIPLRSGGKSYGLIQLNDRKRGAFSPYRIALYERLADSVSYALAELIGKESLQASEDRYEAIIRASMDGFLASDNQARIVDVNDAYCRMSGYPRERMLAMGIADLDDRYKDNETLHEIKQRITEQGGDRFESRHRRADGTTFEVEVSVFPQGKDGHLLCFVRDITERKEAEAKIAGLLSEKETLLREVQHRVKNNLNAMQSLLSIQAAHAKDKASATVLMDAQSRLGSMSLLYDKLYRREGLVELSLKEYLPALVAQITDLFPNRLSIRAETLVDDLVLPVKTLSTLGILINELITNAMKHAFVGRETGTISVRGSRSGDRVVISVEDDGVGMPEGSDSPASSGFGLKLARLLAEQLDASLLVEPAAAGTRIVLEFGIAPQFTPSSK